MADDRALTEAVRYLRDQGENELADRLAEAELFVPQGNVVPTVCPTSPPLTPPPITDGDITVHDAPPLPTAKDQCKNGGWRSFGGRFKNEGQCVAFVQRRPQP
jgi:hypothetical protein